MTKHQSVKGGGVRGVLNHAGPSQLLAPPGRTFHCVINLVGDVSEPLFFYCLLLLLASSLPYRLCFIFLLHTNSLSFVSSLAGEKMKEKKQRGKKNKSTRLSHCPPPEKRTARFQMWSSCLLLQTCWCLQLLAGRGGGDTEKPQPSADRAALLVPRWPPLCSTRTSSSPLFCWVCRGAACVFSPAGRQRATCVSSIWMVEGAWLGLLHMEQWKRQILNPELRWSKISLSVRGCLVAELSSSSCEGRAVQSAFSVSYDSVFPPAVQPMLIHHPYGSPRGFIPSSKHRYRVFSPFLTAASSVTVHLVGAFQSGM